MESKVKKTQNFYFIKKFQQNTTTENGKFLCIFEAN